MRKIVIGNLPFLLTDTVGFIRKLPTQLVESFKSTLDEVRESDILFHVVDISHDSYEDHMASVNQILTELKAHEKPTLVIFNKVDAWVAQPDEEGISAELKTSKTAGSKNSAASACSFPRPTKTILTPCASLSIAPLLRCTRRAFPLIPFCTRGASRRLFVRWFVRM